MKSFEMAVEMLMFRLSWRICVLRAALLLSLCCSLSCGQQCTNSVVCQTPFQNMTSASVTLAVSSTCGDPNSTLYAYPDTLNQANCILGMHPKELMLDTTPQTFGNLTFMNPILGTYWQSENTISYPGAVPTTEYVVVNFTYTYLIYSISIVFSGPSLIAGQSSLTDMRPRASQIQSWNSVTNTWIPWRFFADDCSSRYPLQMIDPTGNTQAPQDAVCVNKYYAGDSSTISRIGYGFQEISFNPARDFVNQFDSNPGVQRHFMTSALRFQFDYPAKDAPLLSYYAIASLSITWKCSCFGHASICTQGQCQCQHNTMGAFCDQCLPTFNDRPWQMGVVGDNASSSICQDCNCNKYSASCHYDYLAGHGICDNCSSNTAGDKCQSCAQYFYVNPSWNDSLPSVQCAGIASDPTVNYTYNCFARCAPCNCNNKGTVPALLLNCDGMSGNCTCMPSVQGRACDNCMDGYWSLGSDPYFGCIPCNCEPSGSLNSISYCDRMNGTCVCKINTQGVRCDQCKVGYFDINITKPEGCTPCGCDVGASVNLLCPAFGGACSCLPFIAGRSCQVPFPGYFGAFLDYLTTDAEFSPSVAKSDIVERYGAGDVTATNTGRGFVQVLTQRSLLMTLIAPFQSLFTLVVRYETNATWSGVQAIVQLSNPASVGPAVPYNCSTGTTYLANALQPLTADIPPRSVAGAVAMGKVCLLPNQLYNLQMNFLSSNPPASAILVDSVVLIPDFSTTNAYLVSNASVQAQMIQCSQMEQAINTSVNQNPPCPQLGFSIMVAKYSRAYDCACNMTGSLSTVCTPLGGQCPCKPNVFLRDCSQCKVNSYGFNSGLGCTQCLCNPNGSFASACDDNGVCPCKANIIGNQCNTCIPQYWGVFTGKGCQPCVCNQVYAVDTNCSDSGQCNCFPGVGGIQCDRCANGFYRLTRLGCTSCGCSFFGSQAVNCDPITGFCACKAQTVGTYCDTCTDGYFGLGPWSNDGCMKCFCSGHSNNCTSAFGWYAVTVNTSLDLKDGAIIWTNAWSAADQSGNSVPITTPTLIGLDGTAVRVMTIDNDFNGTLFYFVAPAVYLGDKRSAYGQYLNVSIILTIPPPDVVLLPVATNGDVFIQGNYTTFSLVTSFPVPPVSTTYTPYSLRLHESIWYVNSSTSATKVQATYEQMMQVLASVASITVRATYFRPAVVVNASSSTGVKTSLVEAGLTYASALVPTSDAQVLVNNVEQCFCPPQYQGQFCQFCAPGFTRLNPGAGLFSPCVECFCNNHQLNGTSCSPEAGACNCTDNTTGVQCELCLNGFYGYPASGRPDSCQPCMCPGNVVAGAVNALASTCQNDGLGGYVCDNCTGGSNGTHCDICGYGYFGTPTNITNNNGLCSSCVDSTYCNGNAWYNQSCNSTTGDCLHCIFNTMGRNCETCLPYYWGSGVYRNCQPCNCNVSASIGRTGDCDKATGTCLCKSNVTSILSNCDSCISGYYNLTNVNGCQPCNCFFPAGSISPICEPVSGNCSCNAPYIGRQCDTCKNTTWNAFAGCLDCGCGVNGSRNNVCNPVTGQCPCRPGFAGRQCTICEAGRSDSLPFISNLTIGIYPNCTACGMCYDSLASSVSQFGVNIATSYNQIIGLWSTSFNNMSYDSISAQVTLIRSSLNTTMYHVALINSWFPSFQQLSGNYSLIFANWTAYSQRLSFNGAILNLYRSSLTLVQSWTGNTQVAPGVFKFPADLAQDLQNAKTPQDSTFNLSVQIFQDIKNGASIVSNVNGTKNSLAARVSIAMQAVRNSQTTRATVERMLNATSTAAVETLLAQVSGEVGAVQSLNADDKTLVDEANFYLQSALTALQQVTNFTLTQAGTIYKQLGDAQNILNSAQAAQRSANTSVSFVSSFVNAAAAAKQLISGNVVSLAGALRNIALGNSILNSISQIISNVGSTSLNASQALMAGLAQQINSTNIPMDKVSNINSLAQQSLALAQAAQAATQQDLANAQKAIAALGYVTTNLTSAQILQAMAQAGLDNVTNTVANIKNIITQVNQKANGASAQANQTNSDISSCTNAISNLELTYPTLALRFRTARGIGELANLEANTAVTTSNGNVNASAFLQSGIDAKTLLLNTQTNTLQTIQLQLNAMQGDLNTLSNTYNLFGTKAEAIQQTVDMNKLSTDLTNLNALLDNLQRQINLLPPNSTHCII